MFALTFNIDDFEETLLCPLIFPPHACFLQYQVIPREHRGMVADKKAKMPDDFSFFKKKGEGPHILQHRFIAGRKMPP